MKRSGLFLAIVLATAVPTLVHADALFVANGGDGRLLRIDPRTRAVETVLGNLDGPSGLAFGSDGTLYVAVSDEGAIRRLDGLDGRSTVVASGLDHPRRLAADAHGGFYFVSGPTGEGPLRSKIMHIYLGQQPTLFQSVEAEVTGLAVGREGQLLVAETVGTASAPMGTNLMIMVPQGRTTLMTHGGVAGRAAPLTIDGSGNVYVGENTRIARVAFETLLPLPGPAGQGAMIDLIDLATDRGGDLFALSQGATTVFLVAPNGAVAPLANGLDRPTAIAFGPDPAPQPQLTQQQGVVRPSPWSTGPAPQIPSTGVLGTPLVPGLPSSSDMQHWRQLLHTPSQAPAPQPQQNAQLQAPSPAPPQPQSGPLKRSIPVGIRNITVLAVAPNGGVLGISASLGWSGTLFGLDDNGTIKPVDPSQGAQQRGIPLVAIAFGPQGAYGLTQRELWLFRNGAAPSAAPKQFQYATGLAVCPDGNAYVVDNATGSVNRFGSDGAISVYAYGLPQPRLIACAPDNTLFLVVTPNGSRLINTAIWRSANGSAFEPFWSEQQVVGALAFTRSGKLLASLSDPSTPSGAVSMADARHSLVGFDRNGNVDWRMDNVDGSGGLVITPQGVIYAAPRWETPDHYYAVTRISWPN